MVLSSVYVTFRQQITSLLVISDTVATTVLVVETDLFSGQLI